MVSLGNRKLSGSNIQGYVSFCQFNDSLVMFVSIDNRKHTVTLSTNQRHLRTDAVCGWQYVFLVWTQVWKRIEKIILTINPNPFRGTYCNHGVSDSVGSVYEENLPKVPISLPVVVVVVLTLNARSLSG